jgi:CheY-like chemotaxis protein
VEGALELLAYNLRTADIKVTTDLMPGLPALSADPDQLSQVITNLIVNAQQALADREGPRRLLVATGFDNAKGMVELSISDNGAGVSPELRSRIFEPFFTTKPLGMGTGIGLSVCNGVVTSHGGTIEVGDAMGGGARFTVLLPAAIETVPVPEPEAARPPASTGRRILVVDDEPEVAEALAEILAGDGYQINVATSGQEALGLVAAGDYDAMISDVRMPDMDGLVLYRGLREIRPGLAARLIMVTGDTLSPSVEAFLAETGLPCIEKPFLPSEIRRIIAEAIAAADPPAS